MNVTGWPNMDPPLALDVTVVAVLALETVCVWAIGVMLLEKLVLALNSAVIVCVPAPSGAMDCCRNLEVGDAEQIERNFADDVRTVKEGHVPSDHAAIGDDRHVKGTITPNTEELVNTPKLLVVGEGLITWVIAAEVLAAKLVVAA